MQIDFSIAKRLLLPVLSLALFGYLTPLASAQTVEQVVVTGGDDVTSAYGAPGGLSRSRFAPLTTAYVLPPWAFYFGEIYEGNAFRHGFPDHTFTQEVEMGLPYRFGVAAEAELERFNGGGGVQTVSLEGRYALADWNKIPLNPTLFAEYKFGVRTIRHEEGPPPLCQPRASRPFRPGFPEPARGRSDDDPSGGLRRARAHGRVLQRRAVQGRGHRLFQRRASFRCRGCGAALPRR